MAVPNRSDEIRRVLERLDHLATAPADEFEDRRRSFLLAFIAEMPAAERPEWGVLVKTERNPPFIPGDILVWRPTMEHIDVSTDIPQADGRQKIKGLWINNGVIPVGKRGIWVWRSAADSGIPPLPVDPPPPPPPVDPPPPGEPGEPGDFDELFRELLASLDRIAAGVENLRDGLQVIAAVADRVDRDGLKWRQE